MLSLFLNRLSLFLNSLNNQNKEKDKAEEYFNQQLKAYNMRECWINVYLLSNGELWQGYCYSERIGKASDGIVYRIHVRMKDNYPPERMIAY